jgi:hypothetical protein
MRTIVLTLTAALAGAVAAGIGWAAIPSSNGVINACRASNGSVKIIDAESGQSCPSSQTALQWSVQGPTGPQGPAGPAGLQGPQAEIGWVGFQADGTAATSQSVYAVQGTSRIGIGHYEIDFASSMLGCARWVVSATGPRMFSIGHLSSDYSRLRVRAYDAAGTAVDTALTVHVSC